jgi:hypothetical protein
MQRIAPLLAAMLIALEVSPSWGAANDPTFRHVLVSVDLTRSGDPQEFRALIAEVCRVLPELVVNVGACDVGLTAWGGAADCRRSASWVRFPEEQQEGSEPVRLTEGEFIFRHARDHRTRVEARLRRSESARRGEERRRSVNVELEPLLRALTSLAPTHKGCTSIGGALERCASERPNTLCLLVTDGVESCDPRCAQIAPPAAGSATVILLLPSRDAPSKDARSHFKTPRNVIRAQAI